MKVRFWGTRGSIPVSLTTKQMRKKIAGSIKKAAEAIAAGQSLETDSEIEQFIEELPFDLSSTYGGASSCVQIETGLDEHVLCDMGSGARSFAEHMMKTYGPSKPQTYHVFMSHMHWDHIMGFPFFTPVYIPGNKIVLHGCHQELEYAFRRQQRAPSFPVDFSTLGATIEFNVLEAGKEYDIAGMTVRAKKQYHEGDSYGWRFEREGKVVIYSTDSEHKLEDVDENQRFVNFFKEADLVIFDAMYSLAETISVKADWGHSSNIMGVELCQRAKAKCLAMFHHEPAFDDAQIHRTLKETLRFEQITRADHQHELKVLSVWDGLEITL
jgi:phosphoribosyl 1,2-cyclic phosphodiesterase